MKFGAFQYVHRKEARALCEYHGWETPGYYTSLDQEFDALTHGAGFVDLSFFGRIVATGKDRVDLLHRLTTNDLSSLEPGAVTHTVFVTEKGRIIDTVTVAASPKSLLLITSPGGEARLIEWINKFVITEDVNLEAVTDSITMASLVGAKAFSVAADLCDERFIPPCTCEVKTDFGKINIVATDALGFPVVHLLGHASDATALWMDLSSRLSRLGIPRVGTMAYEAYRIARGIPSVPGEINGTFNPYEAGLRRMVSFSKGCYVGQEVVARLDAYDKVRRKLVGLTCNRVIDRKPYNALLSKDVTPIGMITSLLGSAVHGNSLGLGIVEADGVASGDRLFLRDQGAEATEFQVVTLPMKVADT